MNKIMQHRPSFIDIAEDVQGAAFDNIESLESIPFVRRFMTIKRFSGFAIADGDTLIATYKNGKEWYVVGFIENTTGIDLPEWLPGERANDVHR